MAPAKSPLYASISAAVTSPPIDRPLMITCRECSPVVAGVVAVHRVTRRGPGESVVDEVLAQLGIIDPHLGAGAPVAVSEHHEGAVPVGRNLDPVGGPVAGDAGPDPGQLAAAAGDWAERRGVGGTVEFARRVGDLDAGDNCAWGGDASTGAERRPGRPGQPGPASERSEEQNAAGNERHDE